MLGSRLDNPKLTFSPLGDPKMVNLNLNTKGSFNWALVKGSNLSDHSKETILFTIDPYCGDFI